MKAGALNCRSWTDSSDAQPATGGRRTRRFASVGALRRQWAREYPSVHDEADGVSTRFETLTKGSSFVVPSFAAYFEPFEQGGGSSGQAYVALPEAERRAMREEVGRNVGDTGGPIGIEVELRFASARR